MSNRLAGLAPAPWHRLAGLALAPWHRLAGPALVALYAATRLTGLVRLPAFLDETWHISWSMSIAAGERWQRPWQYGKGTSVFVNALAFPWAAEHYLWASRAVTVLFGALTLYAVYRIAGTLFDATTARVAAVLYVFCPYALFFDRLFLMDPAMASFAALALLGSIRLAASGRRRDGVLTGVALALAVLSKALGVLAAPLPALAVLLLARPLRRALPALAAAYAVAAAFTAWPLWRFFATTSTVRAAVARSDAGPLERLAENLPLAAAWIVGWWSWPLALLVAAGGLCALVTRSRAALLAALAALVPVLALAAVSQLWFSRYLAPVTAPSLVLAAWALVGGARWLGARLGAPAGARLPGALVASLAVLALLPALGFDAWLWRDPARAPLPADDRFQFVTGWPSGYGVRDTLAFVEAELERHPDGLTLVLDSRARRTSALALNIHFRYEPRLRREDLPLADSASLPLLEGWAARGPTLVIASEPTGGRARPDGALWAHLGGLAHESFKPDGTLCDRIWRLAPAAAGSRAMSSPQ